MFTRALGLMWYRELPDAARPGMLHLVDADGNRVPLCRAGESALHRSPAHVVTSRMRVVGYGESEGDQVPPGAVCVRCAAKLERMLQARLATSAS